MRYDLNCYELNCLIDVPTIIPLTAQRYIIKSLSPIMWHYMWKRSFVAPLKYSFTIIANDKP